MAKYTMAKLTDAGRDLFNKTNVGLSETGMIAVKTSDISYSESDIAGLTDFETVRQIMPIQTYDILDDNKIAVNVTFTNEDLTEGYYIRTFGVFAKDVKNDGEEILYEVVRSDESEESAIYIPPFTEGIPYSVNLKLIIVVSDSANITVQVSPDVFITVELFNKTIEQIKNELPHDIVFTGTLQTGETSITFTDEAIKESSTIDIYTDYYGANPKNVVVSEGKAELTFKALSHDLQVKVVVK